MIRDGRIPRPLRRAGGLGLLPVPGPFDEIALLVVAAALWLGYREQLREAWQKAAARSAGPAQAVVWNRVRAASVRYAFSERGLLPRLKVEE